ncbi:YhcB family protein [Motilimonas eburnea]|uniref:YhcB family protein n=1 Tax=Motilimonas eburnea TaxID=1737488 RepID=UPI001E4F9A8D|nr:DUF1043 family protein [Motilimonas eburnea]
MTEVTIISVFLFALVIGFMIGRRFPSNKQAAKFEQQVTEQQQQLNDYQSKLTACQNDLKQQAADQSKYQQQVSTHFAKTADLMDSIAQQYQTLYQHMSTDAAQLLPAEEASRSISIFKRNKHESDIAQLSETQTQASERAPLSTTTAAQEQAETVAQAEPDSTAATQLSQQEDSKPKDSEQDSQARESTEPKKQETIVASQDQPKNVEKKD